MAKINNRIKLKNVRCSYANFFEPKPMGEGDDAKLKYSTALIIPYDHPQVDELKALADALGEAKFGTKWATIKRNRPPLRDYWKEYRKACKEAEEEGDDPDEIQKPDESTKNAFVINASSERKPQVVDRKVQPILDESEIFSGCYINATVGGFAYDTKGNLGVGWGLNNVQLVKVAERLGGAPNAEEEFEEMDDDEEEFDMG